MIKIMAGRDTSTARWVQVIVDDELPVRDGDTCLLWNNVTERWLLGICNYKNTYYRSNKKIKVIIKL